MGHAGENIKAHEFIQRVLAHPGDPRDRATTLGPLISDAQYSKVLGFYERAQAAGAEILLGGGALSMPEPLRAGYWVQPSLFAGLDDMAEICRSEVFGPCAHISPFDDEDEVVTRVNASDYGLAASVWSADPARAQRVAGQIAAGTVWVNCWRVRDERVAFGGFKKSEVGREGGHWSLDFYSEIRNICMAVDAG